jgi:hypothetical protein
MGANDALQNRKDDKRKAAQAKQLSKRRSHGNALPADWGNATAELVLKAIEAITRDGGAIRFGYTRDGGAYAVGLYENGNTDTEYLKPSDDIDEYLKGIISDYEK